jgi:cellulose synthase/poly-beta-1,6-N-acetylglucosamine synthase-like glycosyltransferase/peptidoglycan/xylan/chitin deacetylase (PgdA/CDA1 family)/spore germination protein YaaH
MSGPVFFDPHGTRRKRVNLWAAALGVLLAVVTTAVLVSFTIVPLLPRVKGLSDTLNLRRPNRLIPALPDVDKRKALFEANKERLALNQVIATDMKRKAAERATAKKSPPGSPISAAFYAPWQEVGITSFRENAKNLTHVMPAWLQLDRKDPGRLIDRDFDPTVNSHNEEFIDIAKRNGVRVWPVVSNMYEGVPDKKIVRALLDDPQKQVALADRLRDWLVSKQFDGLNVDFESLDTADYNRLPQFLGLLQKTLRDSNLGLSIDLEAGNDDLRIKALSENVDLAIVMLYDEHFEGGPAGPIASISWTEKMLDKFSAAVPQNKLVVALGNYAYDWSKGLETESLSYQAALKTAQGFRDEEKPEDVLDLDDQSLNTHFDYTDDEDHPHSVWVLDGVSAFNQWKLAQEMGARGAALWMLGQEDPSIWTFLNRTAVAGRPNPDLLHTVQFGPDDLEFVPDKGGEILYARGVPTTAKRDVEVDRDDGLIVDETYHGYPSSYYIQRSGRVDSKSIALTFDDGPDPANTPQILDTLKELHVPATFFVIGRSAGMYPDLVRRIYNEGHEIGSHTFNHPNLDEVSDQRTEYDLNATERVLQGITGHTTVLFRPPYNADSEPTKPEDVRPILLASKLGYVTVGESIDPQDWRLHEKVDDTGPLRKPREIVDAILFQLSNPDHGNTVLLHDGGGNRAATAKALRILVPELRARGYRFVPVSTLLKSNRDAVMPRLGQRDRVLVGLDKFAFTTLFTFEWLLRLAFLVAIGLGLTRVLINIPLAIINNRRKPLPLPAGFAPTVSVLIAAYNEEKVIGRTIRSILASEYHVDEIIVVDDGSLDETFLEVVTKFADEPRIVALKQENGGKASALNRAMSQARGEILVCIDADTQLRSDAIALLVRPFQDRRIAAVAGNVKVGNRVNLWTKWQSIEYITSQNLDRRAFSLLNGISVCPGAIGAWRKTAVVEAGGYSSDTLAEDMDLTWRLRRAGWAIETESGAIAYTESPDSLQSFFRQRFRWAYGTLQCLWKHRSALGKHGWFGLLTLPGLWLFQILFQVLAPLVDVQLLYSALMFIPAWLSRSEYSKDWRPVGDVQQTLYSVLFLYSLFFTVELVSGLIAYRMDKENARPLWWLFLQRFVYRQVMYVVIYKSIVTAIKGRRQGWGKLERKATVELDKHDTREKVGAS